LNRRLWVSYGYALRFAATLGGIFGAAAGAFMLQPPLQGALFGALSALTDSLAIMAAIGAAEIFLPRTRLGRALARVPPAYRIGKAVAYLAVVGTALAGRLGPGVAALALGPELAGRMAPQIDASFPQPLLFVAAAIVVFLLVTMRHLIQFVGERTARDVARGRYYHPRREERFFLFVDIVGSTPVAERLGPLAVHRYLDRTFQVASDPVDDHRGEVFQYVGDEMVVTWTLADGRPEAQPIACFFAIEAALARAALHAGETVTGEIGGSKRAIVFHGDVMNTASRIENATRELGRLFLVSEDALRRLEGNERYAPQDLGLQQLRGKQMALRVYAVSLPA
jgi:adenylate cyclase